MELDGQRFVRREIENTASSVLFPHARQTLGTLEVPVRAHPVSSSNLEPKVEDEVISEATGGANIQDLTNIRDPEADDECTLDERAHQWSERLKALREKVHVFISCEKCSLF